MRDEDVDRTVFGGYYFSLINVWEFRIFVIQVSHLSRLHHPICPKLDRRNFSRSRKSCGTTKPLSAVPSNDTRIVYPSSIIRTAFLVRLLYRRSLFVYLVPRSVILQSNRINRPDTQSSSTETRPNMGPR